MVSITSFVIARLVDVLDVHDGVSPFTVTVSSTLPTLSSPFTVAVKPTDSSIPSRFTEGSPAG